MTTNLIYGRPLRAVLLLALHEAGYAMQVSELADFVLDHGLELNGRTGKAISDALRWEIRRGRVHRLGHNLYTVGFVPRSTRQRLFKLAEEHLGRRATRPRPPVVDPVEAVTSWLAERERRAG